MVKILNVLTRKRKNTGMKERKQRIYMINVTLRLGGSHVKQIRTIKCFTDLNNDDGGLIPRIYYSVNLYVSSIITSPRTLFPIKPLFLRTGKSRGNHIRKQRQEGR